VRNLDRKFNRGRTTLICGVDEVGRGAIAGPVVAAAVILPANCRILGVNDSKLLTPKQRQQLAPVIKSRARGWAVAAVGHRFIEHNNIACATFWAMRRAVQKLLRRLGNISANLLVLADGWEIPDLGLPCQGIPKGDAQSLSIACASIIAKVYRDEMMRRIDRRFPNYGFARHKGYGTPEHIRALFQFGPSPIHRRTFEPVRTLLQGPRSLI
jgi:ribonuclease HII